MTTPSIKSKTAVEAFDTTLSIIDSVIAKHGLTPELHELRRRVRGARSVARPEVQAFMQRFDHLVTGRSGSSCPS